MKSSYELNFTVKPSKDMIALWREMDLAQKQKKLAVIEAFTHTIYYRK